MRAFALEATLNRFRTTSAIARISRIASIDFAEGSIYPHIVGAVIVKHLICAFVTVFMVGVAVASTTVQAGNCDYSWQSAGDGSACGDRAADRRPGGK